MTREQLVFRAGLTRIVAGLFALLLIPIAYPQTSSAWVLVAYLAFATGEQVLIHQRVGGMLRSFAFGLIDISMVTFLVHRLGASATALASAYIIVGVLNALVVGKRVGFALAGLNVLAYSALVWAEHWRWLPFAPDVPELRRLGPPSIGQTATAMSVVSVFTLLSTLVVAFLVYALEQREKELIAANALLAEQSTRDPLTNLYNRRHLVARLEEELARVRRGRKLSVLMIDLDGFKRVNDTQGHLRGDLLLRELAAALAASARQTDVAGRYGGDEFLFILPDTEAEQATKLAERIAVAVREVGLKFDGAKPITASIGLAEARAEDGVASLMRRADEHAYTAKQEGGGRVVVS